MHSSSQDRPFRTVFVGWIVPVAKATGYTIYPLRGFKIAEVMNKPQYLDRCSAAYRKAFVPVHP